MVTGLSNSAAVITGAEIKYVRSSYALLGLVLVTTLLASIAAQDVWIRAVAFVFFLIASFVVVWRFHRHGPEAERTAPSITMRAGELTVQGLDEYISPEWSSVIGPTIERLRQPLPLPSGVVVGDAQNREIRAITPDELKQLAGGSAPSITTGSGSQTIGT